MSVIAEVCTSVYTCSKCGRRVEVRQLPEDGSLFDEPLTLLRARGWVIDGWELRCPQTCACAGLRVVEGGLA